MWGTKLNTNLASVDTLLSVINTGGSADAYTLTTGQSLTAYANGQQFSARITFDNTGPATMNFDGIGAKNLRKIIAGVSTALAANDLKNGDHVRFTYRSATDTIIVEGGSLSLDPLLSAIAALTTADDRMLDFTGVDTVAVVTYATVRANIQAVDLTADNSFTDTDWRIIANTSDAADSSICRIGGGGGISTARGGYIELAGNEHANLGAVKLFAGNAGGGVQIDAGNTTNPLTTQGALTHTGAATITGALSAASVTGPPVAGGETTGTMTAASANDAIIMTGNMTQAASGVFAARDSIQLDPGTSNRTITRGTSMVMYVNGTDVASATIAANTLAVLYYRSTGVSILSGSGVT